MRWIALIIVISFAVTGASAQDMGRPDRVPSMGDFHTPLISPGDAGEFSFNLTNRYEHPIENATLTVGIYMYATLEEAKNITEVHHAPVIIESSSSSITFFFRNIQPWNNITVAFTISTFSDTPQGTYFIRTMMNFSYLGEQYVMKSRGYFSKQDWDYATRPEARNETGGINLTYLGVDGILVDSSFTVKEPMPVWPLAVLVGITCLFGAAAVLLYIKEDPGFREFKKRYYPIEGKIRSEKRIMKKRKLKKP